MPRSRAWMLSRLAWFGAAALVAGLPGHATSDAPHGGLQRAELPPLLLAVPNECMAVGLDFVPPVPEVESHGRPLPAPQTLPVESDARGLRDVGAPVVTPRSGTQRLPQTERQPAPTMLIDRIQGPPPASLVAPRRIAPVEEQRAPRPIDAPRTAARPAMQAVSERALAISQNGARLADRGAHYSARSEFIQALRVVTQALDAQSGDSRHSQALAEGLRALEEADDFAPKGSQLEADLDLASIIVSHRTPVLKDQAAGVTPLIALQQYYGFAGRRLAAACGHEPSASAALFGLGRLTVIMAERSPDERRLHAPKAMALYQAAMVVDGSNAKAAHELGVLYAQFGQFEEAKKLLVVSAQRAPTRETWHNLAIVHDRLGEADLARMARNEMQLLKHTKPAGTASNGVTVEWVDPSRFAGGPVEANAPATRAASRPAPVIQQNPWMR